MADVYSIYGRHRFQGIGTRRWIEMVGVLHRQPPAHFGLRFNRRPSGPYKPSGPNSDFSPRTTCSVIV